MLAKVVDMAGVVVTDTTAIMVCLYYSLSLSLRSRPRYIMTLDLPLIPCAGPDKVIEPQLTYPIYLVDTSLKF